MCNRRYIYKSFFERERERERERNIPQFSCFIFKYDDIVQHTQWRSGLERSHRKRNVAVRIPAAADLSRKQFENVNLLSTE